MSTHGFDPARLQRINDVIARNYVDTGAIPGALTLVWRRGDLVWSGMSGQMDMAKKLAMREDAIFRLYSMTKPVTAVALLMLMEEGKVALDDPVTRFIPGFANLRLADGSAPVRAMTVLDLLRHTAGFTYGFHNRTPIDAAYRAQGIAEMDTEGGPPALSAH